MPKRPFDLRDITRRRAAGESWKEIGRAYGRSDGGVRSWFHANKAPTMPTTQTFSQPVSTVEPASPLPAEPTPVDVPPVAEPVASDDPFSEPARVVETPSATDSTADVTGPAALGEEAARAYLPLLYGTLDAVAGAMAVWVLRRKLGASTSQALIDQARQIATLTDAERMALEAALVQRLSTVRLSPDEALLLTMGVIYGSKMMAVNSLSGPSALDSSPSTVVSAA